jgi:hypothetical protein
VTNNQRELNKKILDRIASDAQFREQLLDDPRGAMERAGFVWEGDTGNDVSGYGLFATTAIGCPGTTGGLSGTASTAMTCADTTKKPTMSSGGSGSSGGGGGASTAITCPDPTLKDPYTLGTDPTGSTTT